MKLKKVKKSICLVVVASMLLVTGCGREDTSASVKQKEIEDNTAVGIIDYQTSEQGIDSNSKDFMEKLTNNSFYVVHDGIYYPLYTFYKNEDAERNDGMNSVDTDRMCFYTTENYSDIPTFFPGDHIVYYSTDTMLDTILWERYKPLGITFGIYNLQRTTGGRYYLDCSEDNIPVIPDGSFTELYDLGIDYITIDKVGGVPVDDEVVANGIIVGATQGTSYDVEIYTGTYYKHYTVPADTYAFQSYELFMSTNTETLQDCFWEVDIPEYFVNGYYDINGEGMVRIMRDVSYSNETDFSEQLIFPDVDDLDPTKTGSVRLYSDVEELNEFKQTQYPDKLGYKDPEAKAEDSTLDETSNLPEAAKFKEANVKEYELWFPEGKQCTIEIESKSGETSGSAVVTFDTGGTSAVAYNRFDKVYSTVINGKGNTGILTISGFWYDYDIHLTNAEIYNGQDVGTEAVDSTSTKESSDETEVSADEEKKESDDVTDGSVKPAENGEE